MKDLALIIIDVQKDFCPGGNLAVADGDAVVPIINALVTKAEHVIATQDWHPADHTSFAARHPGMSPFASVEMPYGMQTLWPDHCVQGTTGAEFHPSLDLSRAELILRKGFRREIDSYSAFYENDHATPTGLAGYLRERAIGDVTLVGLATDFCVFYSALDAVRLGFSATVMLEACRAIDLNGSLSDAIARMRHDGVRVV